MKRWLWLIVLLVVSCVAHAQSPPLPPYVAYINPGSGWVPWSAALGSGFITPQPPGIALYCSSNGTTWSPCNPSGGGGSVTWPTSGDAVLSNGTNTPTGLAPVNGDCILGAGGAWTAGTCGSMVYPGAGVPNSTGSAWGTSYSVAGSGAGLTSGPTTSTSGDIPDFTGTAGQLADSGTALSSLAPLASPTFTGTLTYATAVGKYIQGVGYTNLYTGSTLDVRVNACMTDAIALTNGNTTGICSSVNEPTTQTIAATITIGNSAGAATTWLIPENSAWSCTVTSGPCLQHYGGSAIINVNPTCAQSGACKISVANGATPTYIYATAPTNSDGQAHYYYVLGLNLVNNQQATSTGIGAYIGGTGRTYDVSTWDHLNVGDTVDTYGLKVYNACCQARLVNSTINNNYNVGTPLYLFSDASGGETAFIVENSTITHPGTGLPNISISDTSSGHASSYTLSNLYLETTNVTSASAAIIKLDGCGTVMANNINFRAEGTSITTPGFNITNTSNCILNWTGGSFSNGAGDFIYPVTAVSNSSTTAPATTDAAGQIGQYSSTNANFVRSLHATYSDATNYSAGVTIDSPTGNARMTGYGSSTTTYGGAILAGQTSNGTSTNYIACSGTTTANTAFCNINFPSFAGKNGTSLSSATTITSTTFVTTGLVLPTLPVNLTGRGHCAITWEQSTGVSTAQFGVGLSATPTDMYVNSVIFPGTTAVPAYTTIANTTTTAVTAVTTPGATATGYSVTLDFILIPGSTNAIAPTIYGLTGNASDALVIEPGSYCVWLL